MNTHEERLGVIEGKHAAADVSIGHKNHVLAKQAVVGEAGKGKPGSNTQNMILSQSFNMFQS